MRSLAPYLPHHRVLRKLQHGIDACGGADPKDEEDCGQNEERDKRQAVRGIDGQVEDGGNRPKGSDGRGKPSPDRHRCPEALVRPEMERDARGPRRLDGPDPGEECPEDDIEDGEDAQHDTKEGHAS